MNSTSSSPERLRKALEWELSLSADDLRSHGWYHGSINRQKAEQLIQNEGDFLVRDCQSRPGDYVLSVKSSAHNQCLHFVINKIICQPHTVYERVQYCFEEESFDTVPDLITFYVGNKRPVSLASGAVISRPINRTIPLSVNIQTQIDVNSNCEDSAPPKPSRIIIKSLNEQTQSESQPLFSLPSYQSCIKPKQFSTYLLPRDNKPLEPQTIVKINSVLIDSGPRILANHFTKCNLDFIGHCETELKSDFGMGVTSALELMLLPQGEQIRLDLLDRFSCMKYFIILSLLNTNDSESTLLILSKWIQVAIECKTALGDCFAFECIMEALASPFVMELKESWLLLRQKHTQTAICYETKLKIMIKNLNEDSSLEHAPNTTFPAIITLAKILQDDKKVVDTLDLQQIYNHTEHGRALINNLNIYKRNAHSAFDCVQFEDLLLDMFKTEFHRKFLWGSNGCDDESNIRIEIMDQLIEAIANQHND